jgi:hypothetical protein
MANIEGMKARRDVKGLIKALDDRDAYTRFKAVQALLSLWDSGQLSEADQQAFRANADKVRRAANPNAG